MKCYLHIGTEKTATTTLQRFFHRNRPRLLAAGYCYTRTAGPLNNVELAIASYDLERRDEFTRARGITTADDMQAYQDRVIAALQDELRDLEYTKAIFSSEHFQSRLTRIEEVKRLKKNLLELGFSDISVIVYLRDPAQTANSAYSTAIKAGSTAQNPPEPTREYYENLCNHRKTLEKFASVFGMESLQPRLFDRDSFVDGSILDDFLAQLGCVMDRKYHVPADENKSISATGLELLRRINQRIPSAAKGKPNPLRQNLVSYFEKNYIDSGDRYSMPPELWKAYDEAFELSNEWVRERWFPDRPRLFKQRTVTTTSGMSVASEDLDRFAGLFADAWIDKQQKILTLEKAR